MGVKIGEIIPESAVEKISLETLSGKVIALDAFNILYQFLATIRGPDGKPLMDRRGRVTSHLNGLFFRTINFLEKGIKPVYVFDGRPPEEKRATVEKRMEAREEARRMYEQALEAGELEEARKYAQRAATLEQYMVESSVQLLEAMNIPYVKAPSEGEAQAAYMAVKGDAYASGSQDMDSLLFGSPRLVRNLSIVGRRKLPGRKEYVEVEPEIIYLEKTLKGLGITREQLVDIALLIGTDYSPQVRGIGPKTALKLVKQYGSIEKVVELERITLGFEPERIRERFLKPNVTGDYRVEFGEPDEERVIDLLCGEYDFSRERVQKALRELDKAVKQMRGRTSLDAFLQG
ncbi:MAG TPA: flap endonuclease-1 [Candidatus Caldiarchaeum subterraneum]|uniref:Flap endonuclease 1 n=1 Tax=Caldiarchaeum subterraneum TaxID=311458 RepID=A0A832ZU09_CALS0|nr:flap endonuclease-1 [Aigarchaeota archaeon]HIQ28973.1 flap endonuclease-1 [Candidatus Caldarchaeum subterraneum]